MTGTVRNLKEKLTGDCAEPLENARKTMVMAAKRCREHKTAMSDLVSHAWEALRGMEMGDQLQRIPEDLKEVGPGSCPES